MKTSELIKLLQESLLARGDIEVYVAKNLIENEWVYSTAVCYADGNYGEIHPGPVSSLSLVTPYYPDEVYDEETDDYILNPNIPDKVIQIV